MVDDVVIFEGLLTEAQALAKRLGDSCVVWDVT